MKIKRILLFLLLILIPALICVYIYGSTRPHINGPYDPGTPLPDPHDGLFVSEHGTMSFNGDGQSITIDFDEMLSEATELPSGQQTGTYVFLSGNMPPHGYVDVRYDTAMNLQIDLDGASSMIRVGLASSDGSTAQTGTGIVSEEEIPLLLYIDGKNVTVTFRKQ